MFEPLQPFKLQAENFPTIRYEQCRTQQFLQYPSSFVMKSDSYSSSSSNESTPSSPIDTSEPEIPVKKTLPISDIFKKIIEKFEKTKSHNINIMDISKKYNLQHRRVYDLFNLLASLHICKNIERGKIAWVSLSEAVKTIEFEYSKIECESIHKTTRQLFELSQRPNLGMLGIKFLTLYLYFDVDTISLKTALSLFNSSDLELKNDPKNIERRFYLVLSMLEILGILVHMKRKGEYRLAIDLSYVHKNVLKRKHQYAIENFPLSIERQLNSLDDVYFNALIKARREELQKIVRE